MTDNEIIKALECCKRDDCDCCPNDFGNCYSNLAGYSLDLINRQQAEIERLEKDSKRLKKVQMQLDDAMKMYSTIKAEAVKEFAERLKERKYQSSDWSHGEHPFVVEESDIDNLVEEMVGAE